MLLLLYVERRYKEVKYAMKFDFAENQIAIVKHRYNEVMLQRDLTEHV